MKKLIRYQFSLSLQSTQPTRTKMSPPGTSNAQDESWDPPLYTHSDSDTLRIQGEIYQNDTLPIVCIGLEDDQMTEWERQQVAGNKYDRAHIRKCIYMVNTLSFEEEAAYNIMDTPADQSAYLSTLTLFHVTPIANLFYVRGG